MGAVAVERWQSQQRSAGGNEGPHPSSGSAQSETGRLPGHSMSRLRIRVLSADAAERKSPSNHGAVVGGCPGMECTQAERSTEHQSADEMRPAVLLHDDSVGEGTGIGDRPRDLDQGERGRPSGGRDIPLSAVEPHGSEACAVSGGPHWASRGRGATSPDHSSDCLPGRNRALPRPPHTHERPQRGSGTFQFDHPRAELRGSSDVCQPSSPGSQQHVALSGLDHATREAWTLTTGAHDREASERSVVLQPDQVLSLVLTNSSAHCYANASVSSLLWAAAQQPSGIMVRSLHVQRLFQWMTRQPQCISLWEVRAWKSLVAMWQDPHRQHDAAEFMSCCGTAMLPDSWLGQWEARLQVLGPSQSQSQLQSQVAAQVVDRGKTWPLVLQMALDPALHPSGHRAWSLQALLIQWRNQAYRHATTALPELILLQLNRFDHAGNKVHHPITLNPIVYVPRFASDSSVTTSYRFELQAIVFHLGQSKHCGHYRSALFSSGRLQYLTDDGTPPTIATGSDVEVVQRNAYLCILSKKLQDAP